jgi:hypothetical protein
MATVFKFHGDRTAIGLEVDILALIPLTINSIIKIVTVGSRDIL